jgi:hypothetical protein
VGPLGGGVVCGKPTPGKPSSLPSTKGCFTPTALMAGSGEKLGTDPWIGQPSCCGFCQEPFFLSTTIDDFVKGCYALTM